MTKNLLIFVLLLTTASAFAQTGGTQTTSAQTKNPVSSALRDIRPGREKNTIAAVEAMPANKFNYKPSADQMTFGHLVTHMIEANYLLCGKTADVTAPKVEEAKDTDSKDKLVSALKASFDFCSSAIEKMDDSKLGESTEAFGGKQNTRAWFALVLSGAWADHYGAAATDLRLNDIAPPTAKK